MFAAGLVLAAHLIVLSGSVLLGAVARASCSPRSFGFSFMCRTSSARLRPTLFCVAVFPFSNVVVLYAARYKTAEAEAASMLLASTLLFVVTVPVTLWLGK